MKQYILFPVMVMLGLCAGHHVSAGEFAQRYGQWKEEQLEEWQSHSIRTFVRQIISLVNDLDDWLIDLHEEPEDPDIQEEVVHTYNFLRELLGRPLIRSLSEIDYGWLKQVKTEAQYYRLMGRLFCSEPTLSQMYLVEQSRNDLKITDTVRAMLCQGMGSSGRLEPGKYVLLLSDEDNRETQIGTIYHEFGHVFYKDSDDDFAVKMQEKTYQELLEEPSFQRLMRVLNHYETLGRMAFDFDTPVGKHINDMLLRTAGENLEKLPEQSEKRQRIEYQRSIEKRADIFALEKLLEHNQLDVILARIERFAFGCSGNAMKGESERHPSDLTRALCMSGFLVNRGIDINQAFKQWYARGTCKTLPKDLFEKVITMPTATAGASDFKKAYQEHQESELKDVEQRLIQLAELITQFKQSTEKHVV